MRSLFDFLSDERAYRDWAEKSDDYEYLISHIRKATLFAIDNELTDTQKLYICKYVFDGKSIPEIAGIYGVNKSTVSRGISRGRKRLMHCLRYTAPWLLNAEMQKKKHKT